MTYIIPGSSQHNDYVKKLEEENAELLKELKVGMSWLDSLNTYTEFTPWINKSKLKRDSVSIRQAIAKAEGDA